MNPSRRFTTLVLAIVTAILFAALFSGCNVPSQDKAKLVAANDSVQVWVAPNYGFGSSPQVRVSVNGRTTGWVPLR